VFSLRHLDPHFPLENCVYVNTLSVNVGAEIAQNSGPPGRACKPIEVRDCG